MPARVLAASVVLTWPVLLLTDELAPDGPLNGKFDDISTAGIGILVLAGLLAAGWLRPLWAVFTAVAVVLIGAPLVYDLFVPIECPPGISGMDCLPRSMAAFYAIPAVLVVLLGVLIQRMTRRGTSVHLLPSRSPRGVSQD